jgi:hypothetical protein
MGFGVVAVCLLLVPARESSADFVASVTSGTGQILFQVFAGQSFTSTAASPETNITFNFFSDSGPATTPAAFATGFLLNKEYLGLPAGLSSATSGYLGQATASGGKYSFGSAVTLLPNTQYFFYENSLIPGGSITAGATYSGGNFYFTTSPNVGFADGLGASNNLNFQVQGTPVPEPSSFILVGMVGVGFTTLHLGKALRRACPKVV